MKHFRYAFQAFQKDQFWLPFGLMALFLILTWMAPEDQKYNTGVAFLGYVLPLIAGGLAAYAFLEDKALEIQFATRRPAWQVVLERLGIVMLVIGIISGLYQVILMLMDIDLSGLGNLIIRQLAWLVPCLAMTGLGGFGSLLGRGSTSGFALVGMVWIIQLLMRLWFITTDYWRNILLFYGVMGPNHEHLWVNQLCLSIIAALLLAGIIHYLKKQERYI